MKVAALDMGSNTTLMLIAEVENGQISKVISDHTTITRLGQELSQSGSLHPEALQRMDDCLKSYKEIIDQENVEKVVSVATSAARDAQNSQELYEIASRYEIPIHIISGKQEAQISFQGATFDQGDIQGLAVVDVGGGSTEVISYTEEGLTSFSLDVGSVRMEDMFISSHPVSKNELLKLEEYVSQEIQNNKDQLPQPGGIRELIAVTGTPTTLAMLDFETEFVEEKIHGYSFSLDKLKEWKQRLALMSVDERRALPKLRRHGESRR